MSHLAPLRDADLQEAVVGTGIRPGDALWRLLAELQRQRDTNRGRNTNRGRRPPRPSTRVLEQGSEV